ncbi:hypothetical protein D3C76_858380 [compost metagenome]
MEKGLQQRVEGFLTQIAASVLQRLPVDHREQRLWRQQQRFTTVQCQVVLGQRQFGLGAEAAPLVSRQFMQDAIAIAQQADVAALQELRVVALDQQDAGGQLRQVLAPALQAAIPEHVQRSEHLSRRLRLGPGFGRAGVVGEQRIELQFEGLHHIGAATPPEQCKHEHRRPPVTATQPAGVHPRRLGRQVYTGAQGQVDRPAGAGMSTHCRSLLSGSST